MTQAGRLWETESVLRAEVYMYGAVWTAWVRGLSLRTRLPLGERHKLASKGILPGSLCSSLSSPPSLTVLRVKKQEPRDSQPHPLA